MSSAANGLGPHAVDDALPEAPPLSLVVARRQRAQPRLDGPPEVALRAIDAANRLYAGAATIADLRSLLGSRSVAFSTFMSAKAWLYGLIDNDPDDVTAVLALGLVEAAHVSRWTVHQP